jgi:hypothetical protein
MAKGVGGSAEEVVEDIRRKIRQGQAMGYSVVYDVAPGRGDTAYVKEIVEIWEGRHLVKRTLQKGEVRRAGRARSKARVHETRSLPKGSYRVKFRVRSESKYVATHEAPLVVR